MHKLLNRQLNRLGLSETSTSDSHESSWKGLLDAVSRAYTDADKSYYLLERSLSISSEEMRRQYVKINSLLETNRHMVETLSYQNEILRRILQDVPSKEIIEFICQVGVDLIPDSGFSVFFVDEHQKVLKLVCVNNLPEILHNVKEVPIGDQIGTCGTAAFLQRPVFTEDITQDANWKGFRILGETTSLRSCWSIPVIDKHKRTRATIAMYFSKKDIATEQHRNLLISLSQLLLITIERDDDREELRKQQLRILAASKKAVLGDMAGSIAHEINNPIAIIDGAARVLESMATRDELSKDVLFDLLNKIYKTVDRIKKVIDALRVYSRPEGSIPAKIHRISDIINSSLALCSERMKNEGVRVTIDIQAPRETVHCNEVQLSQVIINLISNSLDAILGRENRWIEMSVSNSRVNGTEYVCIRVTDSGTGISPQIRDRMMDPFFTTKEVGKGTGIGLSLSLGIIQQHKGQLYCNEHSPNTQFVVLLPTANEESNGELS